MFLNVPNGFTPLKRLWSGNTIYERHTKERLTREVAKSRN